MDSGTVDPAAPDPATMDPQALDALHVLIAQLLAAASAHPQHTHQLHAIEHLVRQAATLQAQMHAVVAHYDAAIHGVRARAAAALVWMRAQVMQCADASSAILCTAVDGVQAQVVECQVDMTRWIAQCEQLHGALEVVPGMIDKL